MENDPSEVVNVLTHFGGALVFLALTPWLLKKGHGVGSRTVALSVFSLALVFQLTVSGIFHVLEKDSVERTVFQRLDHAAIFTLIAGTFTPIHVILFRGTWRWGVLLFLWICAVVGVTLKSVYFDITPPWLGVSIYVGMGWFGLISAVQLQKRFGTRFIVPLVYGGLAYTLGAICLGVLSLAGSPMVVPGFVGRHELFHIAVLTGATFHWLFIYRFAGFDPGRNNWGQPA